MPSKHAQRGAALLLALVLVLTAVGYSLLKRLNQSDIASERAARTTAALATAKQALLAHALLYGELHKTNATPTGTTTEDDVTLPPGTLPCPERSLSPLNNIEGVESGNCGSRGASSLGRLPWRSLGLPPLRDASGECLWYAVSGSFKANMPPHVLNPDSLGQFAVIDASNNTLIGATAASRAVAVIIAPGPPLPGQERTPIAGAKECGGNYTPANYLDRVTVSGKNYDNAVIDTAPASVTTVVTGGTETFNDRIAYITRDELFAAIEKRGDYASGLFDAADSDGTGTRPALAQKLAAMIVAFGHNNAASPQDKRLPWAAPLNVSDFGADSLDDDSDLYAGRLPYRVGKSSGTTGNMLVPSDCSSPKKCRLLIIDNAGATEWWRVAGKPLYASGPSSGSSKYSSLEGWWDFYKDHFFFVVSPDYAPDSSNNWAAKPKPCSDGGNKCVRINGKRFAAAVIFSGKRQAGQQRDSLADRQNPANYLEGNNVDAFDDPDNKKTRDLEYAGNDQIVCINEDLELDSTCTNGT